MAKKLDTAMVPTTLGATTLPTVGGKVGDYRVKRRVTVPLISLTHSKELTFQVEGTISTSAPVEGDKKSKGPMSVVPVINLETGESVTLLLPTVLKSALERVPGGYVDKKFHAVQGPKMPGRDYFQVELFELEG